MNDTQLYVTWSIDQLPYCCGMREVGDFTVTDYEDIHHEAMYISELNRAVEAILQDAEGRPVIFNFVKRQRHSLYDAYEFQAEVLKHPQCKDLGTHVNPGSGNTINTLIIMGYNE